MSLARNVNRLLDSGQQGDSRDRVRVEYHMLSWRELYDKSIVTVDRHSSGAGQWVVRGGDDFFNVIVLSHPCYVLPQRLCLSFDCFSETSTVESADRKVTTIGPPIESVSLEFIVLLSVFGREPLVPLGPRRVGDKPVYELPLTAFPPRADGWSRPRPVGIDSPEFVAILRGLGQAPKALVDAILGAAKFYHAALSVLALDISVAYASLVCAIECLGGHCFKDMTLQFKDIEKFERAAEILDQIRALPGADTLVCELEADLTKREHFLRKKFVRFLADFVPQRFWDTPDPLYEHASALPPIAAENLESCLREIYDRRSQYLHGGAPFPEYVQIGLRDKVPVEAASQLVQLRGKRQYLPPFVWFERLVHLAMVEYLRRRLAPALVRAERQLAEQRAELLRALSTLPENVESSLRKLTEWTTQFLPFAVMGPKAPNASWADCAQTVETLKALCVIDAEGEGLEGSSWLRDREVGEAVGEYFFGRADNPFRDSQLLPPRNVKRLTEGPTH